jgi:hypothetical protein
MEDVRGLFDIFVTRKQDKTQRESRSLQLGGRVKIQSSHHRSHGRLE